MRKVGWIGLGKMTEINFLFEYKSIIFALGRGFVKSFMYPD